MEIGLLEPKEKKYILTKIAVILTDIFYNKSDYECHNDDLTLPEKVYAVLTGSAEILRPTSSGGFSDQLNEFLASWAERAKVVQEFEGSISNKYDELLKQHSDFVESLGGAKYKILSPLNSKTAFFTPALRDSMIQNSLWDTLSVLNHGDDQDDVDNSATSDSENELEDDDDQDDDQDDDDDDDDDDDEDDQDDDQDGDEECDDDDNDSSQGSLPDKSESDENADEGKICGFGNKVKDESPLECSEVFDIPFNTETNDEGDEKSLAKKARNM